MITIKKFKKLLKFIVFSLITIILFYVIIFIYAKVSPKLPINSANSFYMYDSKNNLFEGTNDKWVNLKDISTNLIKATLSIEDKHFYKHQGFDFLRIVKAMSANIMSGKTLQGASTITQQYAKNLYLDFDKKWKRKFDEALLTIRLEANYSKSKILEGYLNTINYGGIFGIENASMYYFNKSSKDLNLAEASILAGIPKSPTNYSPISNYEAAKKRQKLILQSMVKNKLITEEEMNKTYKEELKFASKNNENSSSILMYYKDAVMRELKSIEQIPNSFLDTGGLKIYTSLDIKALNNLENKINTYIDESNELQIAAVIMDPNNGEIKAIAGGKDYSKSEFNRVTDSKRQVGSTMKPFLYYSALENGFTASTTFTSEKTIFNIDNNKTYSPNNYGDKYGNKKISMATAIAYSDNIYAVKTHIFLEEETLVDTAKRLGIVSPLETNPSLALGTNEIGILEMMNAYSAFANEGYLIKPHFITKVEDINGSILYEYKETKKSILNKSNVYILNELLTSSYDSQLIDYNYPTCISIAPKITKTYAIKTGTTNTDHLIFGYNKDVIVGMWMGYDDNRDTEVKDGSTIKNIWIDTIEEYLKDQKNNWYKTPSNVVGVLVNPITGELAKESDKNKKITYYIKGTEPYSQNIEDSISTMKQN